MKKVLGDGLAVCWVGRTQSLDSLFPGQKALLLVGGSRVNFGCVLLACVWRELAPVSGCKGFSIVTVGIWLILAIEIKTVKQFLYKATGGGPFVPLLGV